MPKFIKVLLAVALPLTASLSFAQESWYSFPKTDNTIPSTIELTGAPSTWWHWMDGQITREGITADLEAMQKAGIREAQIFNVGIGYDARHFESLGHKTAKYLSDEWLDLVHFAASEAKRLGMTLCLHNGPGWSSSGGYWVTPENSMQRVVWTETRIETTGKPQTITLPQPEARNGYYDDICVVAFPAPAQDRRIPEYQLKSMGIDSSTDQMLPSIESFPLEAAIDKNDIQILKADKDGNVTLPVTAKGVQIVLLRMGHTTTGTTSHPVNDITGGGLECDKLSRRAVKAFWDGGVQPIIDRLGSLVGTTLNNCLVDSYEVGCGNWTDGYAEEFERRNGYSLYGYLPAFAGFAINSGEETERFYWDLRKTNSDLIAENYYDYFRDLCHEARMMFSTEPYTGPFDGLRVGSPSDIVMGEFWMGDAGMATSSKLASSIAHVNGKSLVGAEAFTSGGDWARWTSRPKDMKALGDKYWCDGINRYIFHTYVHQPTDEAPGYTLERYAGHYNRLNTLWDTHADYIDYVTRSQYLLQQGKSVADILVFEGESVPNNGVYREDIKQLGYDYDEVWVDMLHQLRVENGIIKTPTGAEYRLLVLPKVDMMTPEVLATIKRLSAEGAMIIGPRPMASPSLKGYPECDGKVAAMAAELWDSGKIKDLTVAEAVKAMHLTPDCQTVNPQLRFIHRQTEDTDIYFLSNQSRQYINSGISFRVDGKQPELWDAVTGRQVDAATYICYNGTTGVNINFLPEQSLFVVFCRDAVIKATNLNTDVTYKVTQNRLLPGFRVISALDGKFLPHGVVDVTDIVASRVQDGQLHMNADNGVFADPIFGVVKHLQLTYIADGEEKQLYVGENQPFGISSNDNLKIVKAFYGNVPADMNEERPAPPVDVKERIEKLVERLDAERTHPVGIVAGYYDEENIFDKERTLRITYEAEGSIISSEVPHGERIDLNYHGADPSLELVDGKPVLKTFDACDYELRFGDNDLVYKAKVKKIPAIIPVDTEWSLTFENKHLSKVPAPIKMTELTSLSENENEEVRHFSGTTIYSTTINLTRKYIRSPRGVRGGLGLRLELGGVEAVAEVLVNGQKVQTLWCTPYNTDITDYVKKGENVIEIRVANQWANHLIGEEKTGNHDTFQTWNHWNKDSQLLPAGLLGPVQIRPYVKKALGRFKQY